MTHMTRILLFVLLAMAFTNAHAQAVYAGTLGKQPIHLVAYAYSDGAVSAFYVYDRHDTPIRVDGRLEKDVMTLKEGDVATLRLAVAADGGQLRGEWIPASGKPPLPDQQETLLPPS